MPYESPTKIAEQAYLSMPAWPTTPPKMSDFVAAVTHGINLDRAQMVFPYGINVWDSRVYGTTPEGEEPGYRWALYHDDPEHGADTFTTIDHGILPDSFAEYQHEDDWHWGIDAALFYALVVIDRLSHQ